MRAARGALFVVALFALTACRGITPSATPFAPTILSFQTTTCADLAKEFGAIADPALRSVIDGPDRIADEQKSVLIKRMQVLLAQDVTRQARASGVIADCAMPSWLQEAERGFSDELRQAIGKAAYDGDPVIDYQAWLLELNNDLIAAGMGKA
jgi:hypothetical protein